MTIVKNLFQNTFDILDIPSDKLADVLRMISESGGGRCHPDKKKKK